MTVLSLTYLSSATKLLTGDQLAELLVAWRVSNAQEGLTGMLFYSGGNIIQTLEGPDEAVVATFETIEADPRHTGIIEVLRDPLDQRSFPDWSMGFNDITGIAVDHLDGFNDFLQLPPGDDAPGTQHVSTMLSVFKRYNRI
ncbi:BLUF domain-containing protein [Nocardioides sp. 1609]|uniref:BLUF domain-containing protein n=1 Tax=Nocardioides sp. 1609 TaxID=2508327 RepID=UPI00143171A4|nr:BLUF domain-containing protein [Nocardioides sp. 1609]